MANLWQIDTMFGTDPLNHLLTVFLHRYRPDYGHAVMNGRDRGMP